MKKIIILDFETAEVIVRDYPNKLEDSEDWFNCKYNDLKLRASNSQWMVVDELVIKIK